VTRDLGKDQSALAVFAKELKLARARAGLSQEQLADMIAYSSSLVAMVEGRRRVPSQDFCLRCDQALGTGGALARLRPLVAGQVHPSWSSR
jgi:ribosome-binding protein aMBF1 (putative translation factor)